MRCTRCGACDTTYLFCVDDIFSVYRCRECRKFMELRHPTPNSKRRKKNRKQHGKDKPT